MNPFYKLFGMNKAVFLDRDGVINLEHGDYTYERADFQINDGVIESLKIIVEKGYLLIVVTNQSGIAKGVYDHSAVQELHDYMTTTLLKKKIPLAAIYYCPHHPDQSHTVSITQPRRCR